jgi:DNA-binding response OmpR family regulator
MDQRILLLGCPGDLENSARRSSLGAHYTIQAVCDLRQPEVVSLIRDAALLLLHELAAPRDLTDICTHLRRQTSRPLAVALQEATEDRVVAILAAGADDCFDDRLSPAELVARLRAHLRRDQEYSTIGDPAPYDFGELRVDPVRHEVWVRGSAVSLTPREFDLLECLARAAGRALRRDELLERVWGYNSAMSTRTLDVHVGRVRQKIEQDPRDPRMIVTIPGVGYKLAV